MDNTQNKTVEKGSEVHYRHPDGTCSNATVTYLHNQIVLDLRVVSGDSTFEVKTVVYRREPTPYSWHWPEDDGEAASAAASPKSI